MRDDVKQCVEHLRANAEFQWCSDCYISDGCGDAYKANCYFLRIADLIESLAAERDTLAERCRQLEARNDTLIAKEVLFDEAIAAGAKMQRERDAAVEDLRKVCQATEVCFCCKSHNTNYTEYVSNDCMDCIRHCNWQWRGVKED